MVPTLPTRRDPLEEGQGKQNYSYCSYNIAKVSSVSQSLERQSYRILPYNFKLFCLIMISELFAHIVVVVREIT
jgi:hypothetical protein